MQQTVSRITAVVASLISLAILSQAASAQPRYQEPTEAQMQEALLKTMELRGGRRAASNRISVDNPLSSVGVDIEGFRKRSCNPANDGTGYFCTYEVAASLNFTNNDGTFEGDQHAAAVQTLVGWLTGGAPIVDVTTTRFFRFGHFWIVSEN